MSGLLILLCVVGYFVIGFALATLHAALKPKCHDDDLILLLIMWPLFVWVDLFFDYAVPLSESLVKCILKVIRRVAGHRDKLPLLAAALLLLAAAGGCGVRVGVNAPKTVGVTIRTPDSEPDIILTDVTNITIYTTHGKVEYSADTNGGMR